MPNSKPKTMRSVMYLEPGKLELQEVPVPTPGPGELLVRVNAALTCGTDLKTFRRGHPVIKPPTPFGHEFAGEVVEAGANVEKFKPGMRVVAHNSAPCGHCYWCKHGQESMCPNIIYNMGAYADYILVPSRIVEINTYQLPDELSYKQAAIMEPLSTVVHGQSYIDIQPGERVAILGAGGPIGLMHLQLAKLHGATEILAVDMKEPRLKVAKQLGASHIINASEVNPVDEILRLTDGVGADVVIESAGAAETWVSALKVARKGGRILWFGGLPGGTEIPLDSTAVHYGELTMFGVYHCTPVDVYHAFQLISSGTIDTMSLINGEVPLSKVEEALMSMYEGKVIKVAVLPEME